MPKQTDPIFTDLARAVNGQRVNVERHGGADLVGFIERHGLTPVLDDRIRQGEVTGVNEVQVARIHEAARTHASMDLLLNHATRQVLTHLDQCGVNTLLLKGGALAHLHYRRSYFRTRCDTDLYIAPEQPEVTAHMFEDQGYTITGWSARPHTSRQFGASQVVMGQIQNQFDIHWRLSNRSLFRNTLPFEECWAERQPVPALGPNAWALSNRDLLLHACIHRIAHGRGSERNRLIWLYDIHLLWNAMDDTQREAFISKALEKKIGAVCADALQICDELFATCRSGVSRDSGDVPEELQNRGSRRSYIALRSNHRHEPTAPLVNAGKLRWAWADLKATPGLRAKLQFARELLQNQL